MRFLKLLVLAGLGYAFYEFLTMESNTGNKSISRKTNLTGPGSGMIETAEDPDGASSRHIVGRGVVQS